MSKTNSFVNLKNRVAIALLIITDVIEIELIPVVLSNYLPDVSWIVDIGTNKSGKLRRNDNQTSL